jgi:hypothetical protein
VIFDPQRHEPLHAAAWDASRARQAIERIVAGTAAAYRPGEGWPAHPQDTRASTPLQGLYFGDAGVMRTPSCAPPNGRRPGELASATGIVARRMGDALWLERARAFAMHGIAQVEQAERQFGQWRHSLWTGDPGFAIYLLDCIEAKDRFPTLDVFFPPA